MRITICPSCKKPVEAKDYPWDFFILMYGLNPVFKCSRCGYRGPVIVLESEGKEEKEEGKKKR